MLERIYFNTDDQVELVGLLERPKQKTDRVVISIHGMQSNCLKKREDILSKKIAESGTAYFAFNNRGAEVLTYIKKTTGEKELNGGVIYEDVLDSYYDIKAAIDKMTELGFSEIYLQGHSLGCTKIIYTYNKLRNTKTLENVKGIMLLSLVDILGCQVYDLGEQKYKEMLEYANQKEKQKHLRELMPAESFEHPISVGAYLRYFKYNKEINFARFGDEEYTFPEINNIEIPLFLRWGNNHDLVIQNMDDLIKMLKIKIKNSKLDIGYIEGADHGYTGKEEVLAKEIIKFIG